MKTFSNFIKEATSQKEERIKNTVKYFETHCGKEIKYIQKCIPPLRRLLNRYFKKDMSMEETYKLEKLGEKLSDLDRDYGFLFFGDIGDRPSDYRLIEEFEIYMRNIKEGEASHLRPKHFQKMARACSMFANTFPKYFPNS